MSEQEIEDNWQRDQSQFQNQGLTNYENTQQSTKKSLAMYHNPELSQSFVFALRAEDLQLLFKRENFWKPINSGETRIILDIHKEIGFDQGLIDKLATCKETGIIGDDVDIQRRRKFFGRNKQAVPSIKSFWEIFVSQFEDPLVQCLILLSLIWIVVSFWSGEAHTWLEGASILFALLFASIIQTSTDYSKESKFLLLANEIQQETCKVLRGQYATTQEIRVSEVVVGDVVLLEAGDRVPADCWLIEEMDMMVDESTYFPGQVGLSEKQCSLNEDQQEKKNPNPVLLQGTSVMSGFGKGLVCAVGEKTLWWSENKSGTLSIGEEETPLKKQLHVLAKRISYIAYIAAALIFTVLTLYWLFTIIFDPVHTLFSNDAIQGLLRCIMTAVAILIACIPEGLPLAIAIATALSTDKLIEQNLLIKNLGALENAGTITDIVTSKTGTLTQGDCMKVHSIQCANEKSDENPRRPEISVNNLEILKSCVLLCSDAYMNVDDISLRYKVEGSAVEKCMLNWLNDIGTPVFDKIVEKQRDYVLETKLPFSPNAMKMTVAYRITDPNTGEQKIRVVMKGAPEVVVKHCSWKQEDDQANIVLDEPGRNQFLEYRVKSMAGHSLYEESNGLKTILYAYRDHDVKYFEELRAANNNFQEEEDRKVIENELILFTLFGLEDPIRPEIMHEIQKKFDFDINEINEQQENTPLVIVRILSGDHKETVLACAATCGIDSTSDGFGVFKEMSGQEFRNEMEGKMSIVRDSQNANDWTYKFNSQAAEKHFSQTVANTIIMHRASPEDKKMFIAGLKLIGCIVAMTGDSVADAGSLREANVGMCFGGCDVARDSADIIIRDSNFCNVSNAAKWGRNIHDNVKRFLQFQLTVNLSLILIMFICSSSLGCSPFTVMQLLWINLIMDALAAVALATEAPHPTKLGKAIDPEDLGSQILPTMWRQIYSQVVYQFVVLIVLLYAGPTMFKIQYNLISEKSMKDAEGNPTARMQHFTLMFQTFVLMNTINMFNCRVIGSETERELNVFRRLHHNWFFPITVLGILNFQYAIVSYPFLRGIFGCTPLTAGMHLTSGLLGLGSLLVALTFKFTPYKWAESVGKCSKAFEHRNFKVGKQIASAMSADEPTNPKNQSLEKLLDEKTSF